jgi:serine/threonine-protein kinase
MRIEQLGPYRIGPRLGKGGMGSVYDATDVNTQQRVAVKALAPQLAAAEGFRERFEAEIESLKKLEHDGIVRLYGYGEDNGVLFYSMELVDGPSLEQELGAGRRFDWNETLSIASQICRALKHAHDHGIVHRDIKPANLLLAAGERVKIADFGIARLFGATQLTTAGGILGTADYMSPEQVDGRPVTDRCDQYALGCVMFALLAGRPPFRAKTMAEMLQLQRFAEPEPVRRYAPQTPEQLERLIGQLLSKDPAQRFPNVLVLSRHMEAMQKALSRPAKPPAEAPRDRTAAAGDLAATAAPAMDATLAQTAEMLERLETTDSGVYDGPTMADEDQAAIAAPARPQTAPGAAARSAAPPRASAAPAATPASAPPRRETKFTTVDEERRGAQRDRAEWAALAIQLGALAAALGALAWIGWRLTRPASADDLYSVMLKSWEQENSDLRDVDDEIAEFKQRYPNDARMAEVQRFADELELQKLERRLRLQSRLSSGTPVHPAEQVYADALALADADPARAAQMLADLLALYPQPEATDERARQYLTLAERQLEKLQASLKHTADEQLPQLAERLRTAKGLETVDDAAARRMYQALVNLYGDEPWAAAVVHEAKQRMMQLDERGE